MQLVSSRIWTRIAVFISYGDNDYATGTSICWVKGKDEIGDNNLTKWFKKFGSVCKNLKDQACRSWKRPGCTRKYRLGYNPENTTK